MIVDQEELFAPEGDTPEYEPHIPIVNKDAAQEAASFWGRLIQETEAEDAIALAGGAVITAADEAGDQEVELTTEERYEKLMAVVANKPSHREILLRVLALCCEEQDFAVVEGTISKYPEYPSTGQNPYRLIKFLIDGGGLKEVAVDEVGEPVTFERTVGLTIDEADDLIESYRLRTTEVGRLVAENHTVTRRMNDLFSLFSDRASFYTELLDFCKQPRKFKDIEALFKGRDLSGLRTLHPESGLAIKPTVFVDNMEKAGAIVWKKDGWVLTEGGGEYLEAILRGSM